MNKNRIRIIVVVLLSLITVVAILFFQQKEDYRIKAGINQNELDIIYGSEDANLTIFMYSNYTCSFCRKFFQTVYPQLEKEYIHDGKVKLVVKPIALTNNESAINSLKIAVCLNKYGNLEKLNELLLIEPKVIYTDKFTEVINELTEKDEFVAECMYGGEAEIYLSKNLIDFKRLNCTGTPTFVINDKIYKGFVEYDKFKKVVEKEYQYSLH